MSAPNASVADPDVEYPSDEGLEDRFDERDDERADDRDDEP
jgi:hypothetical protein